MSTATTTGTTRLSPFPPRRWNGSGRPSSAGIRSSTCLTLGRDARRAAGAAPGEDVLRRAVALRRLVGRRRSRRRRLPGRGHAGPGAGPRGDPRRAGQGLLHPQGLSDVGRGPARDRPPHARPLPGAEGPRPARPVRLAAPRDSRSSSRRRSTSSSTSCPTTARSPGSWTPTCAAASAWRSRKAAMRRLALADAGPDGRRDRPRRLQGLRRPQELRRGRVSRGPGREGADVEARRACWSSSRPASRSRTSAATRS